MSTAQRPSREQIQRPSGSESLSVQRSAPSRSAPHPSSRPLASAMDASNSFPMHELATVDNSHQPARPVQAPPSGTIPRPPQSAPPPAPLRMIPSNPTIIPGAPVIPHPPADPTQCPPPINQRQTEPAPLRHRPATDQTIQRNPAPQPSPLMGRFSTPAWRRFIQGPPRCLNDLETLSRFSTSIRRSES